MDRLRALKCCAQACAVLLLLSLPLGAEFVDENNAKVRALLEEGDTYGEYSPEDALRFYKQASDLGSVRGSEIVGEAYLNGEGIKKDNLKARFYFEKAIQLDHDQGGRGVSEGALNARMHLAMMDADATDPASQAQGFHMLQEVVRDLNKQPKKASLDLKNIANFPENSWQRITLSTALYHLGYYYERGMGTPKNLQKARTIYQKVIQAKLYTQGAAQERLKQMHP
ncbi:SEL1-like repeat protein [Helicobacter mehlei]|uniref:beta-lactamase n=1 Tax=Helicobacter mehlei TaxID=2316080 RepID=A0A553ULN6_9HELI|nr:SEL1-like repeat protein [Helicobacter mehlei]TSA81126.1 sel1 repeat family protein [Helicobacter mehlei]